MELLGSVQRINRTGFALILGRIYISELPFVYKVLFVPSYDSLRHEISGVNIRDIFAAV